MLIGKIMGLVNYFISNYCFCRTGTVHRKRKEINCHDQYTERETPNGSAASDGERGEKERKANAFRFVSEIIYNHLIECTQYLLRIFLCSNCF